MQNRKTVAAAAILLAGLAWGQAFDPWLADGINKANEQARQHNARELQKMRARRQEAQARREWEEREAEIQARIAKNRATLWWMAIAQNWGRRSMTASGGYASKQRAIDETMKRCASADCEVLVTFANSCAVIVAATPTPMNSGDFFIGIDPIGIDPIGIDPIGIDPDDTKAAAKAWQACQAVHGDREDRCFRSQAKTGKGLNGTAFCTGYDYSVYGQR